MRRRPQRTPEHDIVATLTVERVGIRGDGVARYGDETVYLPFTAPGDRVRARLGPPRAEGRRGAVVDILAPGERAAPVCPHFGTCGGCALQHLSSDAYVATKEAQIRGALAQRGIGDAPVAPLIRLPPGTRRRARLSIHRPRRAKAAPLVGFNTRASHQVTDMHRCAVLHPALVALVGPLRGLAAGLWPPGTAGTATMTVTEGGVDLLLDLPAPPDLAGSETLAAFADARDLARLVWRAPGIAEAVPVALRRPARVFLSGVPVELPVEAFLQASAEADQALVEAVLAGVGTAGQVADLHAGIGTFSFALAQRVAVQAVDASAPAIAALRTAANRADLADRVAAECRDLEARPLTTEELARFTAVVLDPPRAGAPAQSAALAAAPVPRVVAVSCNPATFARDARTLIDGGFRLDHVQPIDQFVWSPHVELVARFERPG